MPLGIGHFAVGVAGAAVVLLLTGTHRTIAQDGYVLFASGLWAVIPDLGQPLAGVPQTDNTPLADVFWFHYSLDHSLADSHAGTVVLGACMVVALVWLVGAKRARGEDVAPGVNAL